MDTYQPVMFCDGTISMLTSVKVGQQIVQIALRYYHNFDFEYARLAHESETHSRPLDDIPEGIVVPPKFEIYHFADDFLAVMRFLNGNHLRTTISLRRSIGEDAPDPFDISSETSILSIKNRKQLRAVVEDPFLFGEAAIFS